MFPIFFFSYRYLLYDYIIIYSKYYTENFDPNNIRNEIFKTQPKLQNENNIFNITVIKYPPHHLAKRLSELT